MKFEQEQDVIKTSSNVEEIQVGELLKKIQGLIKSDNLALVKDLKGYPDFLKLPEIASFGEGKFDAELKESISKARTVSEVFDLPKTFLEQRCIDYITTHENPYYTYLTSVFKLTPEFIASDTFKNSVSNNLVSQLEKNYRNVYRIEEPLSLFNIDASFLHTKENQEKISGVLKVWLDGYGRDLSVCTVDFELGKRDRDMGELTTTDFKKVANLFGIEDFFKTEEARKLAITHFRFFKKVHPSDPAQFLDENSIHSFRELFSITDDEFQKIIIEKAAGYAERLSRYTFAREISDEKGKSLYYDFNYFSKGVDRLGKFLKKYQVSDDTVEYVAGLILSHGAEVFSEKVSTDWNSGSRWSNENTGGVQYQFFLKLIKEQSFLQPYINVPELKSSVEEFVKQRILKIVKSGDQNGTRVTDIQEICSVFDLQKVDIAQIEVLEDKDVRTEKGQKLDTWNINNFIESVGQVAILNQEYISKYVLEAVTNSIQGVFNFTYGNVYEKFEATFKDIKELMDAHPTDREVILRLTDAFAQTIDRSSEEDSYVDFRRRQRNSDEPEKYNGTRLFNIIKESVGFSAEFSKELGKEELRHQFDSWADHSVRYPDQYRKEVVADAKKIAKKYNLGQQTIIEAVMETYEAFLAEGKKDEAEMLAKAFNILPETLKITDVSKIEQLKIKKITELLPWKIDEALAFLENNPDIKDKVKGIPNLEEPLRHQIIELLNKKDSIKALKVVSYFLSDKTIPAHILNLDPAKERLFITLAESYPKLSRKYLSSFDTLFNIWPEIDTFGGMFQMLKDYPFLAPALEDNERYGLKLLLKFPTLDNLSKKNIETLYKNKAGILEERPDIDVDSRDFRIAMQDKLESYRRNSDILAVLQKSGVNIEEWQNYEDELYFELGRDVALKFSDTVVTPIERIQETINKYTETVKEILGEYKDELTAFRVPLRDVAELTDELEKLRAQQQVAEKAGDTKKANGIAKGIANIEGQIKNPKDSALWDKILANIAAIDLVKKDVFKGYSDLRESEKKVEEKEADTTIPAIQKRKDLVKLKAKIESAKKEIKEKVQLLGTRLANFDQSLGSTISSALGEERSAALIQEKNEQVGELWDHYQTDHKTLENLFFEKEGGDLDGQTMKIGIWNRNPDMDLYLGNYTDCCIRIDSDHMGEESTIADYLTDVGMQIVNIYDQKKKIPIATAWCWIGHDDNDQLAFVIDNIEANTEYSTKYKAQLEAKMKEYIDGYAKKVGAKVVQGQHNNDLLIAPMDSSYFKLGGFNRASGYFLEAEDE